ncbi:MAG: oligosaccharide flippase family protein [Candidatus Hodarchaeales archaeon]
MSKAADMAKVSARGGFHLLWGLVLSTVISSVGTIIVANLLIPDEMGLYYIALTAPVLIQNFRDWGVGAAMIKYSAQYNSENQVAKVKSIIFSGFVFQTVLGLFLNLFTFSIAGILATSAFQRPGIESLIQVSSFILLAGAFSSASQAVFVGLEKMAYNSITMVVQSIIKTVLMVFLVVYGFGALGAVMGNIISLMIAGLTGLMLMWLVYKNFPQTDQGSMDVFENVKVMLRYGVPLSIGTIVSGFLLQFYNIILAIYVSDALIGNYSIATTFVILITFFATPVTTMLLPAFSKIDAKKDKKTLRSVFEFSVKYGSLFVVPVATLVMALSEPAVFALFGDKYESTPLFLFLLAIVYLYTAFGRLSVNNFLNGQGETRFTMKLILLTAGIGFPLSYVLISQYGVIGLIITTLTAGIPSLIISRVWIWKNYDLTIDWIFSVKILFSSAIPAILAYLVNTQFAFSYWFQLIIGVLVFLPVFLVTILLTKTIERSDIDNLRNMTKSLGPIHKIFAFFMSIVEKMMNVFGL